VILPSNRYRDPAEVYEREEEQTCKGCGHIEKVRLFGDDVLICHKHKKPVKRCKHYEETMP